VATSISFLMTVSSTTMTWSSTTVSAEDTSGIPCSIILGLTPAEQTLRLVTGEIFVNPRYRSQAEFAGVDAFSATLEVFQARNDEDFQNNTMIYNPKGNGSEVDYFSDSAIKLFCVLAPEQFAELLANLRGGLTPTAVAVTFDVNAEDNDPDEAPNLLTYAHPILKWKNDSADPRDNDVKHDGITITFGFPKKELEYLAKTLEAAETNERVLSDVLNEQRQMKYEFVSMRRDFLTLGLLLISLFLGAFVAALFFLRH